MCCSSRRTSFIIKPCCVNVIEQVRQVVRGSRLERIVLFPPWREGNWRAFSFYVVEANLAWIHSQPPRRCACVQLRSKGPWLATVASRLRFPYQILCVVTGKDDAEVFCGPLEKRARPTFRAGSWNKFASSCVPSCGKGVSCSRNS